MKYGRGGEQCERLNCMLSLLRPNGAKCAARQSLCSRRNDGDGGVGPASYTSSVGLAGAKSGGDAGRAGEAMAVVAVFGRGRLRAGVCSRLVSMPATTVRYAQLAASIDARDGFARR